MPIFDLLRGSQAEKMSSPKRLVKLINSFNSPHQMFERHAAIIKLLEQPLESYFYLALSLFKAKTDNEQLLNVLIKALSENGLYYHAARLPVLVQSNTALSNAAKAKQFLGEHTEENAKLVSLIQSAVKCSIERRIWTSAQCIDFAHGKLLIVNSSEDYPEPELMIFDPTEGELKKIDIDVLVSEKIPRARFFWSTRKDEVLCDFPEFRLGNQLHASMLGSSKLLNPQRLDIENYTGYANTDLDQKALARVFRLYLESQLRRDHGEQWVGKRMQHAEHGTGIIDHCIDGIPNYCMYGVRFDSEPERCRTIGIYEEYQLLEA